MNTMAYITPTYTREMSINAADYTITYDWDDDHDTITFAPFESVSSVFAMAAREICFSDCSGVRNVKIHCGDQTYHYTGWQPGMVYEFADDKGNIVWTGYFPQWDH